MTAPVWQVRWERGAEGRYRVGTAAGRTRHPERTTVLFLLGRGDSLELRQDVATRLVASGARVVAVEHVGQGASPATGARPDAVHVGSFGTHVEAALAEAGRLDGPAVLLGHSMGGLVALHVLAARPDRFATAVLTSPMWGWAGSLPVWMARVIAGVAVRSGRGRQLAVGERPFDPASCLRMRGATDDQARALLAFAAQHPELVRGGSTWGWVLAASRSMHQLAQLPLQQVRTAVTVVRCFDDQTVSLPAQARVAARLPRARVVELAGGHDPFVGRVDVRAALWDEVELAVQQAGRDS